MDISTIAGLIAITWVLVSLLGRAVPWVSEHQELSACALALGLSVAAKAGGYYPDTSWVALLLQALVAALGSGVAHDKLAKPLKAS
jgi:hypothetical protein